MDAPIAPDPGPAGRAWRGLGRAGGPTLVAADVVRVDLPFREPVATSAGIHRHRPLVLVHLVCRSAAGEEVEGWGECAALGDRTYDDEDVDDATAALVDRLLPALASRSEAAGALVAVSTLADLDPGGAGPLARAALEAAVGDAHLRAAGRSLADLVGVAGATVAPGAVLGLPTSSSGLVTDLGRLAAAGYARAKVKVAPGAEQFVAAALGGPAGGGLPVQVDANGAYGPDTVDLLAAIDGLGLLCVEQPLARDDLAGHRALAARLVTPVCLDESLTSPAAVVGAVTTGACSVVCVKPGRLGGVGAALDVIEWCRSAGVTWWVGGMFESGVGRPLLATLAALAGSTGSGGSVGAIGHSLPGDLAPPSDYLVSDLVTGAAPRRHPITGGLLIPVYDGPGVGPAPEAATLARSLVRRRSVPVRGR